MAIIILAAFVIMIATPTSIKAASSGTCGGCTWTLDDDWVLTISPTDGVSGTLINGNSYSSWPWNGVRNNVKEVHIENGVMAGSSINYMFYNLSKCTVFDVGLLDIGSVTSMRSTFRGCNSLPDITALGSWDTGNVTDLYQTFSGCSSLSDITALGNWDTGSVTNLYQTFSACTSLSDTSILGNWDTGNVTDMNGTFSGCTSLSDVSALGSWDTGSVSKMSGMFSNCTSLSDVTALGSWDTGNVSTMQYTFSSCTSLSDVTALESWDTGNVTNICGTFSGCTSLSGISALGSWDTGGVTNMESTFSSCASLSDVSALGSWDTGSVTNMKGTFSSCGSLSNVTALKGWDTGSVTNMQFTFYYCRSLSELDLTNWNTQNVTNMSNMLSGCSSIQKIITGENFSYKGNNISSTSYMALPPTPPTNTTYTGKWIREDEAYGPYTATQLRDNYTPEMAGTWVWEERPTKYTIRFAAPEGASGSMPDQKVVATEEGTINTCEFKRFDYHFDHWEGSDGRTYTDGATIPANTFNVGNVLTLTAVLIKNEHNAEFVNGEAEITLHAGEKVVFPELSGGTRYEVTEWLPSGWQIRSQSNTSGTIPANGTADAEITNEYVPGITVVQLVATKTLDGRAPEEGAFTFRLSKDGEVVGEATNSATGIVLFDTLVFRQPGTYTYTISEVRGNDAGINYDTHEETVTITVTDDGTGTLTAATAYDADGAKFTNETKPGTLTVTKQTDGKGDPDEEFNFEIRLTDELGRSLGSAQIVSDWEA